jgi:hypothetical protein
VEQAVEGADVSDPGNRTAAAGYIADLTRDLAAIARGHRLETLGYILEMARLEAEASARRG